MGSRITTRLFSQCRALLGVFHSSFGLAHLACQLSGPSPFLLMCSRRLSRSKELGPDIEVFAATNYCSIDSGTNPLSHICCCIVYCNCSISLMCSDSAC